MADLTPALGESLPPTFRPRYRDMGDGTWALVQATVDAAVAAAIEDLKTEIVLAAGENHIGQVGGEGTVLKSNPTMAVGNHVANDVVGGKLTLAGALRADGEIAVLQSLVLVEYGNLKPTGYLIIFDSDPNDGSSTITDDSALALATVDKARIIDTIPVQSSDWYTVGNNIYAEAKPTLTGTEYKAASGTSLYAAFVVDAAYNPAAATNLQIVWGLLQS